MKQNIIKFFVAICLLGSFLVLTKSYKVQENTFKYTETLLVSSQSNIDADESNFRSTPCSHQYRFDYKEQKESKTFTVFCGKDQALFSVESSPSNSAVWFNEVNKKGGVRGIELSSLIYANLLHDVTGDNVPDLIVTEASLTPSRSFTTYHILSFGENFTDTIIDTGIGEAEFIDINEDGILEVIVPDLSVSRDEGGWTGATTPYVILENKNGKYKFSSKFMKREKPDDFLDHIRKAKVEVQKGNGITQAAEDYMRELIYHGQGRFAWDFLDQVSINLPAADKAVFENDFVISLNNSKYLDGILAVNGWDYRIPEGESCPLDADRNRFRELKTKY